MSNGLVKILDGNTFVVSDARGDIEASLTDPTGLFSFDTRFLSTWVLTVNGERLNGRLMDLRRFGGTPAGGTHRLGYSEEDRQARALVMSWMREAGLTPATDFAGNLIGRRAGAADLPPIVFETVALWWAAPRPVATSVLLA